MFLSRKYMRYKDMGLISRRRFLEEDRAGSEESGGYGIASCLHAVLYVAG